MTSLFLCASRALHIPQQRGAWVKGAWARSALGPLGRGLPRAAAASAHRSRRSCGGDAAPMSSPPTHDDTIFALATGSSGAAGVAVLRISGKAAAPALAALTGNVSAGLLTAENSQPMPRPRRAALRKIFDPKTGRAFCPLAPLGARQQELGLLRFCYN